MLKTSCPSVEMCSHYHENKFKIQFLREYSQYNCVILHMFYITDSFFLNFVNVLAITFSLCLHFNSIDKTLSKHVFHVVTKYF